MNNHTTSEVLDLAADEIQRRGWGTGAYAWRDMEGAGALCLEGGIAAALGEAAPRAGALLNLSALTRCPAYKAVQEYLETDRDLWLWNDTYGRTEEDVIAVLRAAAAVERAKEAAYAPVEVAA